MLPEDRELEEMGAEVSERYRRAATEQPPARLDAAILEAARREAVRPRLRRDWKLPASIAAVVVVGVSLALLTREVVDPLPPPDRVAQADLAKPSAPQLEMKAKRDTGGRPDLRERPSRERIEPQDSAAESGSEGADIAPRSEPAPRVSAQISPAPPPIAPPAGREPEQFSGARNQEAADAREAKEEARSAEARRDAPAEREPRALEAESPAKSTALADASEASRDQLLRKQAAPAVSAAVASPSPERWIRDIRNLLAAGREAEARSQLAEFRKRFPDHRLPEDLRALQQESPS